jgi:hypothetical protein
MAKLISQLAGLRAACVAGAAAGDYMACDRAVAGLWGALKRLASEHDMPAAKAALLAGPDSFGAAVDAVIAAG